MSTLSTPPRTDVVLRWMVHLDLPHVVRISRQTPGLHWTEEDFLVALRSMNTIGLVAEVEDRVVGFVIYEIRREDEPEEPGAGGRLAARLSGRSDVLPAQLLHIDLLNLAVAPGAQRQGIGRAMLNKLEQKIRREGGRICTAVPESNLAAQLFLRDAGFRATEVWRDHFDGEDAYLMERWASRA